MTVQNCEPPSTAIPDRANGAIGLPLFAVAPRMYKKVFVSACGTKKPA